MLKKTPHEGPATSSLPSPISEFYVFLAAQGAGFRVWGLQKSAKHWQKMGEKRDRKQSGQGDCEVKKLSFFRTLVVSNFLVPDSGQVQEDPCRGSQQLFPPGVCLSNALLRRYCSNVLLAYC